MCYWRDRVPDALELLKTLAADEAPRVRLEAVRAASFFTVPKPLKCRSSPRANRWTNTSHSSAARRYGQLNPYVKEAIASGKPIHFTTAAGSRYFVRNVSTDDLLKMKRSAGVYVEMLFRPGIRDEFRKEALAGLATSEKKSELKVLVDAIREHDAEVNTQDSVAFDLVRLLTDRASQLGEVRNELQALATKAKTPITRQLGYAALIAADGNPDRAWTIATGSVSSLKDLVNAMPLIRDIGQRLALYPKIVPLLDGLPANLASSLPKGSGVMGRTVRIELPGRQRTLTLAEVEVYSDGVNVALHKKATQSSTAYGGPASRAVDGNKSGTFGDGGQTHTREGQAQCLVAG